MTIRILLAEDNRDDAALIQRELRRSGVDVTIRRVDSAVAFRAALDEVDPDVVLTDHSMPQFTAHDALKIARDTRPATPVIVVTGSLDEETAADYIKEGAGDYVLQFADGTRRAPENIDNSNIISRVRAHLKR